MDSFSGKIVIEQVKPEYVSCIIQINTDDTFITDLLYLHAFDDLERVRHQMEEKELLNYMDNIGYKITLHNDRQLPNGKKLVQMDFNKECNRI